MIYGAKEQLTPEDDTTPPLDSQGKKRVQGIAIYQNYNITTDWEGTKFAGIDLTWDYNVRHTNRLANID